jgi:hypothetical protein
MGQVLILLVCYSICASVVLVWTTLLDAGPVLNPQGPRSGVQFVAIPECSIFELAEQDPNLVIFDVHTDRRTGGRLEFISYWLPIHIGDLPSMLKWLPPGSRVVFCCKNATEQIDMHAKCVLLRLGIKTVYFLSGSPVPEENRWLDPEVTARDDNRELRRVLTTEARRRQL